MLPKSRRIPRGLFKPLLEKRKYFNSEHFSLRIAPSKEVRVTVSVSKKISKKAVVRNQVRRRVYSAMRDLVPSLRAGLYLVVVKHGSEKTRGEELKHELKSLVVSCLL